MGDRYRFVRNSTGFSYSWRVGGERALTVGRQQVEHLVNSEAQLCPG